MRLRDFGVSSSFVGAARIAHPRSARTSPHSALLRRFAAAPRSAANAKALKGDARCRLRVGDWRVIYTLLDREKPLSLTLSPASGARVIRYKRGLRPACSPGGP